MHNGVEVKNDARKARLSDPVLLEVFMRRRKYYLENGYSLVSASVAAHEAVDEVLKQNAPVVVLSQETIDQQHRDARKWSSEV